MQRKHYSRTSNNESSRTSNNESPLLVRSSLKNCLNNKNFKNPSSKGTFASGRHVSRSTTISYVVLVTLITKFKPSINLSSLHVLQYKSNKYSYIFYAN